MLQNSSEYCNYSNQLCKHCCWAVTFKSYLNLHSKAVHSLFCPTIGVSKYLEPFEQSECGGSTFTLSSGCLHGHQLGSRRGGQLLVTGSGERGDVKRRLVLLYAHSRYQVATTQPLPGPPHSLIEDMLHGQEVQTGGHLEEQTAETGSHGLCFTLTHLSGSKKINMLSQLEIRFYAVHTSNLLKSKHCEVR